MTTDEFIKKNQKAVNQILTQDTPLKLAAFTAVKTMRERIFVLGRNANGGRIGTYDTTTPLYVNPNIAPRATRAVTASGFIVEGLKPTRGKHGDHKFKNGKVHKTTYVKSYKELRKKVGRPTDTVNLVFTGDLQSDFSNGAKIEPVRFNQHLYKVIIKREKNREKIEGIEHKYGRIFKHTPKELDIFKRVVDLEMKRQFAKAAQ